MTDGGYMFGPRIENDGVRFRLWAPSLDAVSIEIDGRPSTRMRANHDGWQEILIASAGVGTRYRFRAGELVFPDPASRLQAGGPHGWSIVTAPLDALPGAWKGRSWKETVLYEIHPGIAGGFKGIGAKLAELTDLGITAIELMPISAFPGARNWGYDGVLPFAPAEAYGAPQDLRAMIEDAHAHGVMVFLDVVYNHFGPDGNYLSAIARPFFRDDIATPWGSAIDFRQEMVRRFFLENARYWINEFGFDGLRFDAVHAIRDEGWLDELAKDLRAGAHRQIHLVIENEDNDAQRLRNGFTAQWNDDFHHALHVLLTGETRGYYKDFADEPAEKLARALSEGFIYQGELSSNSGAPRGSCSADLSPLSFVSFLQNHDQIGNRAFGERLTRLADPGALRAAVALLLLSPQIPLIFEGEEIGSRAPFLFFTDHPPELAQLVREGRKREFAAFLDEDKVDDLPDPNAARTFDLCRPESDAPDQSAWRAFYTALLRLRREILIPYLDFAIAIEAHALGSKAVFACWKLGTQTLTIACNLGTEPVQTALPAAEPIWGQPDADKLPPYTTIVWLEK
jgi:maltooligosyltrehalose trehalohydrolase